MCKWGNEQDSVQTNSLCSGESIFRDRRRHFPPENQETGHCFPTIFISLERLTAKPTDTGQPLPAIRQQKREFTQRPGDRPAQRQRVSRRMLQSAKSWSIFSPAVVTEAHRAAPRCIVRARPRQRNREPRMVIGDAVPLCRQTDFADPWAGARVVAVFIREFPRNGPAERASPSKTSSARVTGAIVPP